MAGHWIKIRHELFDDPRTVALIFNASAGELREALDRLTLALAEIAPGFGGCRNAAAALVVGALVKTWTIFDQHTTDGRLEHYTPEALDHAVGLPGWSRSLEAIGWLEIRPGEALEQPRFDTHNGQSAKARAQDSRSKAGRREAAREREKTAAGNRPDAVRQPSGRRSDKPRTRAEGEDKAEGEQRKAKRRPVLDGARFTTEEAEAATRNAHMLRRAYWPTRRWEQLTPQDRSLTAKIATLAAGGAFSDDDLAQILESARLKRPQKPGGWLHKCAANKLDNYGEDFNQALAATKPVAIGEDPAEAIRREAEAIEKAG